MLSVGNIGTFYFECETFLDVAESTALTPLSLLVSCNLSLPAVGSKISSGPALALKFLTTSIYRVIIKEMKVYDMLFLRSS
jgi:hypothetical protein